MKAVAIHSNKTQGARTRALADFKNGKARVLVATDIAARGLDIELLPHVVNFDLPQVAEDYIHRIGRTGRAGASGEAVTLLSADEARQFARIEKIIKQKIERKIIDGFEPNHTVPNHSTPSHSVKTQTKTKPAFKPRVKPKFKSKTESKSKPKSNSHTKRFKKSAR